MKMAGDVEALYQPLLDKGYVSKLQLMQAMDERTEMSRLFSDAENQISQYRQTLAALQAQRDAYIQKWHSETGAELVTERNALDVTQQNLQKAQKLSDLATLDSPADAIVLQIGKVSSGSVAAGGGAQSGDQGPLFTLVPLDAPVNAEIKVNARDIGFIKVGEVETIIEGSFTTDENNAPVDPYFKIRVGLREVHLRNVPADFRLIPGMTLDGDIMVGRRTILSYLVEGALRTGSEAMREP
jgi:HlyD family secretion protein